MVVKGCQKQAGPYVFEQVPVLSQALTSAFCVTSQLMQYEPDSPSNGAAEWEEELCYYFLGWRFVFLKQCILIIFDVQWSLCFTSFSSVECLFMGNKPLQTSICSYTLSVKLLFSWAKCNFFFKLKKLLDTEITSMMNSKLALMQKLIFFFLLLMYHVGNSYKVGATLIQKYKLLFSVRNQNLVRSSLMLLLSDFVSTCNSGGIDSVSLI